MKKIFLGFVLSFILVTTVFADTISLVPNNGSFLPLTGPVHFNCTDPENDQIVWTNNYVNGTINDANCTWWNTTGQAPNFADTMNASAWIDGTFTMYKCNPFTWPTGYGTEPVSCASPELINTVNFKFVNRVGFSIFGGTAPSRGPSAIDGSVFDTGLQASVGKTVSSTGPIVATVAGIILAFAVINYLVKLFRSVDSKKIIAPKEKGQIWVQTSRDNGKWIDKDSKTFGGY